MSTTLPAEARAKIDELAERGYVPLLDHEWLRPGVRVRNDGERYDEAFWHGTGEVAAVMHRPESGWAEKYGRPDIEVVVLRDPRDGWPPAAVWADYGCHRAAEQPKERPC